MSTLPSLKRLIVPTLPSISHLKDIRPDLKASWHVFDVEFEKWRQNLSMILQREPLDNTIADLEYLKAQAAALQSQISLVRSELLKQIQQASQSPDITNILERLTLIEMLIAQLLAVDSDIVYVSPGPVSSALIQHNKLHPKVQVLINGEEWDVPTSFPDATHVRIDMNATYQITVVISK